jgi:hypothetical protein
MYRFTWLPGSRHSSMRANREDQRTGLPGFQVAGTPACGRTERPASLYAGLRPPLRTLGVGQGGSIESAA